MARDRDREEDEDDLAFLRNALASLADRRIRLPILVTASVQIASNVLAMAYLPTAEHPNHRPYVAIIGAAMICYVAAAVAIQRILNASPRPAWRPDWSTWTYAIAVVTATAMAIVVDWRFAYGEKFLSLVSSEVVSTTLLVPVLPWLVAIAVARPLAWRPSPWLRQWRKWLPALLLWTLLILVPADVAYRLGSVHLSKGSPRPDWPVLILVAVIAATRLALGAALASTAYRRVARS